MTGSRITWFVIVFMFALPSMTIMFRGGGEVTREVWTRSVPFAVVIAVVAAILFGKGK